MIGTIGRLGTSERFGVIAALAGTVLIGSIEASAFLPDAGTETGTDSSTSDLLFATGANGVLVDMALRCAVAIHVAVERDAA